MRSCRAFTLLELLVASAITLLLVGLLCGVVMASMDTIGRASKSVEHHEGVAALMRALRDDVSGLRVLRSGQVGAFYLGEDDEGDHILAMARPEALISSVVEQGYVRHVEYRWSPAKGTLSRTVYHSSRDRERVRSTSSSPDNLATENNLARLQDLTPAYAGDAPFDWLDSEAMVQSRQRASEAPFFTDVKEFRVECVSSDGVQTAWEDPAATPDSLRILLALGGGTDSAREFEILVPVTWTFEGR